MTAADARRIATLMADLMHKEMLDQKEEPPSSSFASLSDILHVGMVVIQAHRQHADMIEGGMFPIRPAMLAALACFSQDPSLLVEEFTAGLAASDEDPLELEATLLNISVPKAKLAEAMAEMTQKLHQQAKAHSAEDSRAMFVRWESLKPPIQALLEIKSRYPLTATAEALHMLTPSFPGLTRHVELHIQTMEAFAQRSAKFARAKQLRTRAQLLAAAIVAEEFGVAEIYCLQRLEEMRRMQHGRMRRPRA
jgi:hypothetical protein